MRRLTAFLIGLMLPFTIAVPLTSADVTPSTDDSAVMVKPGVVDVKSQVRRQLSMRGFGHQQWKCAAEIVYRESRFHPDSFNAASGAVGLFQIKNLPRYFGVKRQVERAVKYLNHRYGRDWCAALKFHNANGWW